MFEVDRVTGRWGWDGRMGGAEAAAEAEVETTQGSGEGRDRGRGMLIEKSGDEGRDGDQGAEEGRVGSMGKTGMGGREKQTQWHQRERLVGLGREGEG